MARFPRPPLPPGKPVATGPAPGVTPSKPTPPRIIIPRAPRAQPPRPMGLPPMRGPRGR